MLIRFTIIFVVLLCSSCTEKPKAPMSQHKQALSSTQKSAPPAQVKAKLKAWREAQQKRENRPLLQQIRASCQQRWQAQRTQREARRLRLLQRARNIRSQLVKVQEYRKQRATR